MPDQQAAPSAADEAFPDAIRDRGERTPPGVVGALGETTPMQVLPSTALAPGFGVRPALAGNAADTERLGRDYARALLHKYTGNTTLASAAYNAGPGKVDQWIAQFGDPRSGKISEADWLAKLPSAGVRAYAGRVAGAGAAPPTVPGPANPLSPTTAQVPRPGPPGGAPQASAGPPSAPSGPDPQQALRLLQLLVPPTHSLAAVDYDPWAIQRQGIGRTG